MAPEVFGAQVGQVVEVPITAFLRGFLAGADPGGAPPPNTVALLAIAEPSNFAFASFHGPGSPYEPVLNLILTVSQPVELP